MNDINFISTCASDFVEIYVGSGPKKVREVFETARQNKPCIIFIDELEAIGIERSGNLQTYSHNVERFSTLNQLLSEMDGIADNSNIVVIASTNREDLLDQALVRPGRFDYKINIKLPSFNLRKDLFNLYLNKANSNTTSKTNNKVNKGMLSEANIEYLAGLTEGYTGALIQSMVNDAATLSLNRNKDFIEYEDLINAFTNSNEQFLKFKNYEINNTK